MKLYWWNEKPNWGDHLSQYLLEKLVGITPEWATPSDAEIVIVGSVLDVLPSSWNGIIAGAGKLHERTTVPRHADILGVRGHLTARGLTGHYAVGDPGLLVDELIAPQIKTHNLGVVPHWSDTQLAARFAHLDPFVIQPSWTPEHVIAEIGSCKKIVSSSLHGIIVADAFGIPRRAEMFANMNNRYEGSGFKFLDYASGIDFPMNWGLLQEPPRGPIERAQAELFDMIRSLP